MILLGKSFLESRAVASIQRMVNQYRIRVQELLERYAQSPGSSEFDWSDNF